MGGGTAPQTSNAARLALDGRGGTGGILGNSVVGEVPGRGDTVPPSFAPTSAPSCPSPLGDIKVADFFLSLTRRMSSR